MAAESVFEGIVEVEHIFAEKILEKDRHGEGENPDKKMQKPSGYKHVLCHVVFFLLGVCHFLPSTFLNAPNNFWMYKFRNTSLETGWNDADNRVFLQTHYPSVSYASSTFPTLAFGIFNVIYGNRIKLMTRVIGSLLVTFIVFAFFTASVLINTDDYQWAYFIAVMLCNVAIAACITVNVVSTMSLFPRFPSTYIKTSLIGEGCAGIVGDIFNIITVWIVSEDINKSTLMYFIAGTFVVGLTLGLNIWINKMTFFQECVKSIPINKKATFPTLKEMFYIFKKIKLVLGIMALFLVGLAASYPGISALVVSEQDGTNSLWALSYFSPVMNYLLADCGMLLGRVLSYTPWKMPPKLFLIFAILRTVVFIPLIWLCNAQPRSHLPVLFDRDWEFGLILICFMTANGYLINKAMIFMVEKVDNKEADLAFTLFGLSISIMQTCFSFIGVFIVDVL